ncbi:MAG: cysteine--tRNA ligase [Rhizobiales bacterium 65-9]|nr:cysteine--tRNA ligase [Hyphomicrobiales bacterium]OJY33216.1 MAG: cysteine--tRNA ligase [Rhizobiales bacterium 65-9]
MATLRLHNTLTRTKEEFRPLDPTNVRMYVCGPTVYDYAHIGNARPVIVFDVLFRLLRHLYGADHVTYVRNITDVDDKINARAFERWTRKRPLTQEIRALTDGTLAQFHKDVDALGALRPTHEPRATDFVANGAEPTDMVRIIARLIERGHAYEAEGHVLFHVPSMPDYGKLSRRNHDDMIAGARVDVAPYKRDPMDFVLWKPSNPETEPGWESPWGYGRPGWHIECSAMSGALLGETFDIHAGGLDLIFPHHENEIAQTCCAFGVEAMASVWLHNGFLQVEGEKMSKSLGNFVTINELLTTDKFGGRSWPGEVLRLAMLKTHYRQPIDWTVRALEEAEKELRSLYRILAAHPPMPSEPDVEFLGLLSDDLNTHAALTRIRQLAANSANSSSPFAVTSLLKSSGALLGLLQDPKLGEALKEPVGTGSYDPEIIEAFVEARLAARVAKNWAESDRIRDELLAMGIALRDNKDGTTTWDVKR